MMRSRTELPFAIAPARFGGVGAWRVRSNSAVLAAAKSVCTALDDECLLFLEYTKHRALRTKLGEGWLMGIKDFFRLFTDEEAFCDKSSH